MIELRKSTIFDPTYCALHYVLLNDVHVGIILANDGIFSVRLHKPDDIRVTVFNCSYGSFARARQEVMSYYGESEVAL